MCAKKLKKNSSTQKKRPSIEMALAIFPLSTFSVQFWQQAGSLSD
jgi:hypothetical protein